MRIQPVINLSTALAKERKTYYYEKKNPLMKIVSLMNQYHSIDDMFATPEEKTWAKNRLETQVRGLLRHVGTSVQGSIKASFKSKVVWEETRNIIS